MNPLSPQKKKQTTEVFRQIHRAREKRDSQRRVEKTSTVTLSAYVCRQEAKGPQKDHKVLCLRHEQEDVPFYISARLSKALCREKFWELLQDSSFLSAELFGSLYSSFFLSMDFIQSSPWFRKVKVCKTKTHSPAGLSAAAFSLGADTMRCSQAPGWARVHVPSCSLL